MSKQESPYARQEVIARAMLMSAATDIEYEVEAATHAGCCAKDKITGIPDDSVLRGLFIEMCEVADGETTDQAIANAMIGSLRRIQAEIDNAIAVGVDQFDADDNA